MSSREPRLADGDAQAAGGQAETVRRGARHHLRHTVVDATVLTTEEEETPTGQRSVGERTAPPVDAGHAEGARVAEADGDDRRVGRFLAVLVQPESGPVRVQVHDGGVR